MSGKTFDLEEAKWRSEPYEDLYQSLSQLKAAMESTKDLRPALDAFLKAERELMRALRQAFAFQ